MRLELAGNGRVTPHHRGVAGLLPSLLLPERYLPNIYRDPADADAASFLERLLANLEGFYSEIEGKMRDVSLLFDARSAPGDTLDWLAGWYGLLVDPLWADVQARRVAGGSRYGPFGDAYSTGGGSAGWASYSPRFDRRRLFIRYARKLYQRRGTLDGIRFALLLLLDPCLEMLLERFKQAALNPDASAAPRPGPAGHAASDADHRRASAGGHVVRLRAGPAVAGAHHRALHDPRRPRAGGRRSDCDCRRQPRFRGRTRTASQCLTPQGMSPEEEAMVSRIIDLEKPAHTEFELRRFWDAFRIGEIRLGLDTVVGPESRFAPIIVGQDYLADGYLVAHTSDGCATSDCVIDRDPLR